MISNKQKWVLGGLVTLSAAIWTPQVMEKVGGATSSQVGVDAGPNEEEMLSIEMETMGHTTGAMVPAVRRLTPAPATAAPSGESPSGQVPAGVEAPILAAGDGQLTAGGSTAIVSEVLRTLRQTEAFKVDNALEEVVDKPSAEALGEEEAAAAPPSLVTFLQANPLRGTIVGETTNMALIGKHRVHLGDMVPGTAAVLTEVARGRATLMEGSMMFDLELQPLETSKELMLARSRSQGQSEGAGAGEGLPQGDLPDPDALPGPAAEEQAPESSELPGSAGDF